MRSPCSRRRGARDVGEDAGAEHRDHERRAADRQERQRDARHGQQPDDRADVDHGLPDDPRGDAGGEQHAEAIGRALRDPEADEPEAGEQPEHEQAADEAELLADDREDEVGVRVREEQPLGAARAEPDAVHAAAPERDQRLRDLVAGVPLVVPRMQEREHPRAPVGRRERERGHHEELDAAEELDDGDPADLAARYAALRELLPNLTVAGGCCGTDIRHVTAICDACLG